MNKDQGACPGSQAMPGDAEEASPPVGFDPARSLDALLEDFHDEFRNTLLDRLDTMWMDGQSTLSVPELNALSGAAHELQVLWGLHYNWHRKRAIATEAGTAATVEQGAVHEGAGPQDIAQGPSQ